MVFVKARVSGICSVAKKLARGETLGRKETNI